MLTAPSSQRSGIRIGPIVASVVVAAIGLTIIPVRLALYRSAGFIETGPFGRYAPDPLSVFMEKTLTAHVRSE